MNSSPEIPIPMQVDDALDRVEHERSYLLSLPATPRRSERLAEVYRREAELWSYLFTQTNIRVYWRAVLEAEVQARRAQRYWSRRAADEIARWPMAVPLPVRTSSERIWAELTGGAA